MKNKKYLIIPVVVFLALLAVSSASAYGGDRSGMMQSGGDSTTWAKNFEDKMGEQAKVLGMSVTDLKAKWAEGKNIHDIAKEKGISDTDLRAKMQAQKTEQMKQYLKSLVDSGSITQAQADVRLKFIQEKQANKKAGKGFEGKGQGRGNCVVNK